MTPTLYPIHPIPGLYISDRFSARSKALLASHGITHILSVTRWEDGPLTLSSSEPQIEHRIIRKQVDLDDDPTEDILWRLNEMLDWIQNALASSPAVSTQSDTEAGLTTQTLVQGRVLVHCVQGISRSGAVIVAYLMRALCLPYTKALSLARESRPLINPNIGFEYQLRIWEGCGFEAYFWDRERDSGRRVLRLKPSYQSFKDEIAAIFEQTQYRQFLIASEEWMRSLQARLEILRG
ncbi:protein-tyrosine phosphatase-like protein [Aspergillus egyptiacus]|nr:protein-tyrosine phosphatase-like protein [Aspergillus egyptiacus]